MDAVTQAYHAITEMIRAALAARSLQVAEEHHHAVSSGSRYLIVTGAKETLCLVWDGTEGCFRLQSCREPDDFRVGSWHEIGLERFDPRSEGAQRVQEIVGSMEASLTRHLGAA